MGENSRIEWTHHTFNPWIGCTKVSPGCDNCYAERDSLRRGWAEWGPGKPRHMTSDDYWRQPFKWNKAARDAGERHRVFCASLADVFDNEVPDAWRMRLWETIEATPNLDWLLLTKRIGNADKMIPGSLPMDNVWLGISVVNQAEADRDIPKLIQQSPSIRFLSCEPLLGPVNIGFSRRYVRGAGLSNPIDSIPLIDWVIVGGESGPNARPMHPDWARQVRDECATADVPFFFKQWGEWLPFYDRERDDPDWRKVPAESPTVSRINLAGGLGFNGDRVIYSRRVGKKAAGATLDGREHREFPR